MLDDENAAAVGEICRRLDGIPLAIELAAARVNVLSLRALNERLANKLPTLGGGARTAAPRQQTMAAAIGWSYDLLSPQEQRVFERLSVFAGGCTLELAAPVCGDAEVVEDAVLDLLMSLVDKSLLVADLDRHEPRYALLEPFRQYAREKLSAQRDEQIVLQRQAKALLMLAKQLERDFDVEADRVREALQEELDNWRAALQWALAERRDVPTGLALVASLYLLWKLIPFEGRRWVTTARDLIDNAVMPAVRVAIDYADTEIAGVLRDYERMLSSGEQAFAEFCLLGDTLGMARAQGMKCAALINFRRFAEAKRLIRKMLTLSKRTGERHVLAYAYRCLAFIIGTESPAARRCLTKAIQLYEAANDSLTASSTLCELGGFEVSGGDPNAGLAHLGEALEIDRARNDVAAVTRVLGELATNLIDVNRYGDAERYAREALDLARRHHLDFEIILNLWVLVAIAVLAPPSADALDGYANAARALGYADARLALMGSSRTVDGQTIYESALTALRGVFDADRLAGLMAEGAAMSEDDAVEAALSAAPSR